MRSALSHHRQALSPPPVLSRYRQWKVRPLAWWEEHRTKDPRGTEAQYRGSKGRLCTLASQQKGDYYPLCGLDP